MEVFDDIEKEEALEMAEFCRNRVPNMEDCIEAGREWHRMKSKAAAWKYLEECAELEGVEA